MDVQKVSFAQTTYNNVRTFGSQFLHFSRRKILFLSPVRKHPIYRVLSHLCETSEEQTVLRLKTDQAVRYSPSLLEILIRGLRLLVEFVDIRIFTLSRHAFLSGCYA